MERVSGSVPLYTLIHRGNDLSFPLYSLVLPLSLTLSLTLSYIVTFYSYNVTPVSGDLFPIVTL